MKRRVSLLQFGVVFMLAVGACVPGPESTRLPFPTPGVTRPGDWVPPLFPGATSDVALQGEMTAVAATPEALDESAYNCFGFPVHNAVFHAYRTTAKVQDVMDFYSKQMPIQGWRKIAGQPQEAALPRQIWQLGESGPLVAYILILPMQDGRTLIYLSVAESDSPHPVLQDW